MISVKIQGERIEDLLRQILDPIACERLTASNRSINLKCLEGINFLFDDLGTYRDEVNTWQIERALKTLSPDTRATRSSAVKAVIGLFDQRNLRWQDCTELAHMNLLHQAVRGADNPLIKKSTWNQWIDHWYPFLRWAEGKGYIDGIGFEPSDVRERGTSKPDVRALGPTEFRQFLSATETQRMRAGAATLAGTGLRVAELADLTISQIPNPDHPRNQGRSYIEGTIVGKGNKRRTIYWPIKAIKCVYHYIVQERAIAVEALIDRVRRGLVRIEDSYLYSLAGPTGEPIYEQRPDAPLWLAENGDPLSYHRWGKEFRKVSARLTDAGIYCSPHSLRHTYAIATLSMLIKAQMKQELIEYYLGQSNRRIYFFDPLREVQARLGHASIETTMVYLDHIAEHRALIRMAIEELQAAYLDG